MGETIIKIEHVSKEYRLGAIGGGTLKGDLQSLAARIRGKEDPNARIGQDVYAKNQRFLALDDVSFSVEKGERVGIIGHNGAGKSTLLKLLSRVTAPTKGTISFNGRIASMLEVGTGFHPELTGRENVYLNGAILGMSKAEITEKFDDIVRFAEMEKFIDTPVKRYSSGMYVKLAFAVAAHLDSEILVMDEVLAVGDMKFQQKCLGKMDDVSKNEGRTVLYVSHNMNTIRQLCTRCVVLDHGKVVFDGDVDEAISIYMSEHHSTLPSSINLDIVPRSPEFINSILKMKQFDFISDNGAYIKAGSSVQFKLKIESEETTKKICLRYMIYFSDGIPVGMATTSAGELEVNNGFHIIRGLLNTELLAPGSYWIKLALYQINEFGSEQLYDVIDKAIHFNIDDSNHINNMTWNHQWWGHIYFQKIPIF